MPQKNVIIIDDSQYVVDKLKKFVSERLNFNVVATANDGSFALELYKKYHPDLVFLDIMMPIMDGVSALSAILKEDPGANVMMVSAVRGDSMLRCMVLGAKGYIEKPIKLHEKEYADDFIQTVREILGPF
jgi:two-component system, chemotaxis family, chemotaxis protein CheY